MKKLIKQERAITLIALVITIIILLILAGITINLALAPDGIIKRAQEAEDRYTKEQDKEIAGIGELENTLDKISKEIEGSGSAGNNSKIPEGLKLGDVITYTPETASYNWQVEYCSSGDEEGINEKPVSDVTLTNTDSKYKITEWTVLDINETTGEIQLISAKPTEGTVYLGGAQGYNNGVKLLNDACSALYGNDAKGIKARSIKIEDIENKMEKTILENAKKSSSRQGSLYTDDNAVYPVIYEEEKQSVINGITKEDGLSISQQTELISRDKNGATNGHKLAETSIQPYSNYFDIYDLNEECFIERDLVNYYKMFADWKVSYFDPVEGPVGEGFNYWIASRSITPDGGARYFSLWMTGEGSVGGYCLFDHNYVSSRYIGTDYALRPVLILDASVLQGDKDSGWNLL